LFFTTKSVSEEPGERTEEKGQTCGRVVGVDVIRIAVEDNAMDKVVRHPFSRQKHKRFGNGVRRGGFSAQRTCSKKKNVVYTLAANLVAARQRHQREHVNKNTFQHAVHGPHTAATAVDVAQNGMGTRYDVRNTLTLAPNNVGRRAKYGRA